MKALILNNEVVQIEETEFEVHESLTWMDAPEGCSVGWVLNNGALEDPSPKTEADIAAEKLEHLRMVRNKKLRQTDWWASSDLTMTQAQIDYRQALRDITNTYSSLEDAVFPTKPE
jgi:hypothetical protein